MSNTMSVNGKMCTAFGSAVHSQDECDAIRDEVERLLLGIAGIETGSYNNNY